MLIKNEMAEVATYKLIDILNDNNIIYLILTLNIFFNIDKTIINYSIILLAKNHNLLFLCF